MSDLPREPAPPDPDDDRLEPIFPGDPGRKKMSSRRRTVYAGAIVGAVVLAIVVAVVAATREDTPPSRTTSISQEDLDAPLALRRAAAALNFEPVKQAGVGKVENQPAETGPPIQSPNLLTVGTKAPPFTLKTPAGKTVSLSDYRGKAVLLELFAAWCPHCNAEAPYLAKLARTMPASKYAFVSIDGSNESAATVYAFHRYFGLPYPALLDPSGEEPVTFPTHGQPGPVSLAYHLAYFPTFYVIDPNGVITWRGDGEQPTELLQRELERAAGES